MVCRVKSHESFIRGLQVGDSTLGIACNAHKRSVWCSVNMVVLSTKIAFFFLLSFLEDDADAVTKGQHGELHAFIVLQLGIESSHRHRIKVGRFSVEH